MDKVTSELVTTEQIVHHFYCDECGEFINSSVEWDDIEELEDVPPGIFVDIVVEPHSGFKYAKNHLCPKCKDELYYKIVNSLRWMGFEE